jgi:AcrR family transcriptional regulator
MSKGSETKRRIVEAAEEVVRRDGVGRRTLEATATEASLSKGGVLHHFGSRDDRLGAALIAAAARPDLVGPLRMAFDRWQARVEDDGIDPVRATVVRLAADGLWLSELFGLAAPSASLRAAVDLELVRMAQPE